MRSDFDHQWLLLVEIYHSCTVNVHGKVLITRILTFFPAFPMDDFRVQRNFTQWLRRENEIENQAKICHRGNAQMKNGNTAAGKHR